MFVHNVIDSCTLTVTTSSRIGGDTQYEKLVGRDVQKFTKVSGKSSHCPPFFGHPNAMASWISGQDGLNRNSARRTQFPSEKYVQQRHPYVVVGLMRVSVLKLISMHYTSLYHVYNHNLLSILVNKQNVDTSYILLTSSLFFLRPTAHLILAALFVVSSKRSWSLMDRHRWKAVIRVVYVFVSTSS